MTRPDFIAHYTDHLAAAPDHYPGSEEPLSQGAPLGRLLGLRRIGLHVELLPPGRRTSWPHAEEKEEEFVFVLEGTPDAWIDGALHRMREGDLAAFPAGTGIAHTFINNTDQMVRLLVGGESLTNNRIFYPLHPDRNAEVQARGWYWEEHPEHALGPHDGLPDAQRG